MASNPLRVTFDRVASVSVTAQEDHTQYGFMNEYRNVLRAQLTSQTSDFKLCLGLYDVFIALFLVLLILMTIFGNILVVLSVFVYQRMRTFTNILLTSLATADLLVGLVVMPLSLLDLLHSHKWPLGRVLCGIWATTDVLLCTASILNLCVISLDRYMAITRPLRYPRTRSKKMAAGLLSCVWLLSLIICSPPWFVPGWGLFTQYNSNDILISNITSVYSSTAARHPFACVYSPSVPYRIYSALGSFYIPLLIMLSVYFKIFRVASEREALMRQSAGTCRLSTRLLRTRRKSHPFNGQSQHSSSSRNEQVSFAQYDSRFDLTEFDDPSTEKGEQVSTLTASVLATASGPLLLSASSRQRLSNMGRECHSMADLNYPKVHLPPTRKNTEANVAPLLTKTAQLCHNRLLPQNLLAKAQDHYQTYGPGRIIRGSKEKMVYLRERKALKTIGIVVLGFIICWMPFFVLYLIEVFVERVIESRFFSVFSELFLWLGYSNSVLNPIIYTMYNGDFRRCFRDLLSFGCVQQHRRTMSVKKLHQQSTIF